MLLSTGDSQVQPTHKFPLTLKTVFFTPHKNSFFRLNFIGSDTEKDQNATMLYKCFILVTLVMSPAVAR